MHKKSPPKTWREFTSRFGNLGSVGKLVSWSEVKVPPEGHDFLKSYIVGIIELNDGRKISGQLCDIDENELNVGLKVKSVLRVMQENNDDGIINYGIKWTL